MTSAPGWHPDPTPQVPGQPPQLRYWDGTRWTEHTALAQPPAPTDQFAAGLQRQFTPGYAQPVGTAYGVKPPATTPDGEPLAGWWARVGAYLLDGIILGIITALVALPWIRDVWHTYADWLDDAIRASENGTGDSLDTGQLQRDLAGPLAIIIAIQLVLGFSYHVGFLLWRQATPGKLMVGLRVRLRERPGRMPFGTVALRWLAQFGIGVVGLVPFVGSLVGLYSLLDDLWPLWDDHKQAIHDKVAKTNVVRVR